MLYIVNFPKILDAILNERGFFLENLSSLKVFSLPPQNFEEPFVVGCIDILWNHAQDNMTTSRLYGLGRPLVKSPEI